MSDLREWFVYIIRCDDQTLYTGISTDPDRRIAEHRTGSRGANYFAGRNPAEIVYREGGHDRSSASRREAQIKLLSRSAKLELVASSSDG